MSCHVDNTPCLALIADVTCHCWRQLRGNCLNELWFCAGKNCCKINGAVIVVVAAAAAWKKKNAPCGHNVLSTFSFRDVCVWIHDGMLNTAVFFNCSLLTTLVNRGYVLILIVYPAPSGCVVILTELRPFPLPHFSFRLCYCCFYKKWQKKVPILWFKCCQCKLSLTFDFWRHYWVERHNSNSNCFKSTKKTNMAWFCCWQLIWDDDSDTNKLVQINLSFFFCS